MVKELESPRFRRRSPTDELPLKRHAMQRQVPLKEDCAACCVLASGGLVVVARYLSRNS